MSLATNIPFRNTAFIDVRTGAPTEAFFAFLLQLFQRTGGTETPEFDMNQIISFISGITAPNSQDVQNKLNEINDYVQSQQTPRPWQELQNRLDELSSFVYAQAHTDTSKIAEAVAELQQWAYTQNHTDNSDLWEHVADLENYLMATPLPAKPITINYINVTSFLNGWSNLGAPWAPARYYRDYDNIVRLSGVVTGGTAGTTIFQLPSGFRPAYQDIFPAVVSTGSTTYVTIDTSGNVTPNGSGTASLSFSGITFRAA